MTFFGSRRHVLPSLLTAGVLAGTLLAVPALAHETYTVEPGDTLSEIAQQSGTSTRAIMNENGLASPHRIRIGQQLRLPHDGAAHAVEAASATPAAAPSSSYTVASGDTIGHIAVRLGVRRADLIAANDLKNPNRIRVGQTLVVPDGGVAPQAAARYPQLPDRLTGNAERLALVPLFERWSEANDLPVDLVMAVAWQESGWNNAALSHKGAVGIGQIMPATGVWVATDLIGRPNLDASIAEDNIRMSARYLRWLINYLGDEDLALAGYYQGPGAVKAGIMYGSTERYVANVQAQRLFFTPT
jgi:soluble lytic murein transglycosylase-like protein